MANKSTLLLIAVTTLVAAVAAMVLSTSNETATNDSDIVETDSRNDSETHQNADAVIEETDQDFQDVITTARNTSSANELSPIFREDTENNLDQNVLDQFLADRLVQEYRVITPDIETLRAFIRDKDGGVSPELNLTGDYSIRIAPRVADDHTSGWQTGMTSLIGMVDGEPESSVTMLLLPDGSVRSTIISSKGRYRVESSGQLPYHIVWLMKPHNGRID